MTGHIDDQLRALIRVPVGASWEGPRRDIEVWVDTAFNGALTIPQPLVDALGLVRKSSMEVVLGDGRLVDLPMFDCYLDWFGRTYQTQIFASDGIVPLLGTMLLDGHRLTVDYTAGTVELI